MNHGFGGLNDHNRDTLFRKVRDRAGLGPEYDSQNRLIKEGLNFHDGRATFATWAASLIQKQGRPAWTCWRLQDKRSTKI